MEFHQLPILGNPLDAGRFFGLTTDRDGNHFAVVLLDDKPAEKMNQADALAFAASLSAELPNPAVAELLSLTARDKFDGGWHWTSGTCDWDQTAGVRHFFTTGNQVDGLASGAGLVRLVRLLRLTA